MSQPQRQTADDFDFGDPPELSLESYVTAFPAAAKKPSVKSSTPEEAGPIAEQNTEGSLGDLDEQLKAAAVDAGPTEKAKAPAKPAFNREAGPTPLPAEGRKRKASPEADSKVVDLTMRGDDTGFGDPDNGVVTGPVAEGPLADTRPPLTLDEIVQKSSISMPPLLKIIPLTTVVLLGGGLLGLFLISQTLIALNEVSRWIPVMQWAAYGLIAMLATMTAWGAIRALGLLFRLRSGPQVSISQIDAASRTGRARQRVYALAREPLTDYLRDLSQALENPTGKGRTFTVSQESHPELAASVKKLLMQRPISDEAWTTEFQREVVAKLDDIAMERVRYYRRMVFLKTAISPYPLVDAVATLYNAFFMIGDLMSIYNRRGARMEILALLAFVVFSVYIAGEAQDLAEDGLGEVTEMAAQTLGTGVMANKVLSFAGPKMAEGIANSFLITRVGKRTIKSVTPIRV